MLSKITINPANFSGSIMENISQWVGIDISKATLVEHQFCFEG
ncbi:Mobile element protein [Microcystis aeruginosa NIES-98]|nr:Mobile element protein [Microcystis aeruginosa NIES-98]